MEGICKGQIKPRMNSTLFERKQTAKQQRKQSSKAKPHRKQSVCHHFQMQLVDILVSKHESRTANMTKWVPT